MGYPKLVALFCLAALAACDRAETESPHYQEYGAEAGGGVVAPVEADTYTWDWDEADVDVDQRVMREEWDREVTMFDQLDTDDDGSVSQEEVERAFDEDGIYEQVNGDGQPGLSRDEVRGGLFDALDADDDGYLGPKEWPWSDST